MFNDVSFADNPPNIAYTAAKAIAAAKQDNPGSICHTVETIKGRVSNYPLPTT